MGRLSQTPRFARGLLTVYLETQTQVGDTVQVTYVRDGVEERVPVTLTERPQ